MRGGCGGVGSTERTDEVCISTCSYYGTGGLLVARATINPRSETSAKTNNTTFIKSALSERGYWGLFIPALAGYP
jgi:hypothetical protein